MCKHETYSRRYASPSKHNMKMKAQIDMGHF